MKIPVSFRTAYARADKQILVDSGATDNFIHPQLIKRLALGTQKLERARKIWNIDGTKNKARRITEYVDLSVQTGQKHNKMRFLVTDLGHEDLILGYPWLATFEPKFGWANRAIDVTVPSVTLARKVSPGLQDLQTRAQRILAEKNAEKAKENTWISRMVAAESIGELDGLIKSRAA